MSFTKRSAAQASTMVFASLPSIRVRSPPTGMAQDHEAEGDRHASHEARWEELFDKYPVSVPATSEEVADLVGVPFLAQGRYITGTVVTIDGGHSRPRSVI